MRGFWIRVAAFIIDYIVVLIVQFIVHLYPQKVQ